MRATSLLVVWIATAILAACGIAEPPAEQPALKDPPTVPQTEGPNTAVETAEHYDFEADLPGTVPAGFSPAHSGKGEPGVWEVLEDPAAPAGPRAVAQIDADSTNYRFPVLVLDGPRARDVELAVSFKPISGKKDQAAGLVWRYQDPGNYYVVRANALEDNVVLYKMEEGKRSDLTIKGKLMSYGVGVEVPVAEWSGLEVRVAGELFTILLNGEQLFQVEDSTFPQAGKVGLWTKADSVTWFDDLRLRLKDGSGAGDLEIDR